MPESERKPQATIAENCGHFALSSLTEAPIFAPVKSILLSAVLAAAFTLGAQAAPQVSLKQVAEGFVSPTALQDPGNADYLLVADQVGIIYKVKKEGGVIEPWLDLTSKLVELFKAF